MTADFNFNDLNQSRVSTSSLPAGIAPTASDAAQAALRATLTELFILIRVSPEQAAQFIESAVNAIYVAGEAHGLNLPVMTLGLR